MYQNHQIKSNNRFDKIASKKFYQTNFKKIKK